MRRDLKSKNCGSLNYHVRECHIHFYFSFHLKTYSVWLRGSCRCCCTHPDKQSKNNKYCRKAFQTMFLICLYIEQISDSIFLLSCCCLWSAFDLTTFQIYDGKDNAAHMLGAFTGSSMLGSDPHQHLQSPLAGVLQWCGGHWRRLQTGLFQ